VCACLDHDFSYPHASNETSAGYRQRDNRLHWGWTSMLLGIYQGYEPLRALSDNVLDNTESSDDLDPGDLHLGGLSIRDDVKLAQLVRSRDCQSRAWPRVKSSSFPPASLFFQRGSQIARRSSLCLALLRRLQGGMLLHLRSILVRFTSLSRQYAATSTFYLGALSLFLSFSLAFSKGLGARFCALSLQYLTWHSRANCLLCYTIVVCMPERYLAC